MTGAIIAMAPHSRFVTQAMVAVFGLFTIAIVAGIALVGIPYVVGWIAQGIGTRMPTRQRGNSNRIASEENAILDYGEDVGSTPLETACWVIGTLLVLSIGMVWLADRWGETRTAVAGVMRILFLVSLIAFLLAGGLLAGLRRPRRK